MPGAGALSARGFAAAEEDADDLSSDDQDDEEPGIDMEEEEEEDEVGDDGFPEGEECAANDADIMGYPEIMCDGCGKSSKDHVCESGRSFGPRH